MIVGMANLRTSPHATTNRRAFIWCGTIGDGAGRSLEGLGANA
jgi:hypothetical protein